MNIIGIGTDLVSIARIESIWTRFGLAFAKRILSLQEQNYLTEGREPVPFLAKRYAAKEAVAKALGTGFRPQGILLTDITVNNDPLGKPYFTFSGGAAAAMQRLKVTDTHLSLSDEKEFALAFVVLTSASR